MLSRSEIFRSHYAGGDQSLVTDRLSDYLFTPSADGDENLLKEGVAQEKIFCVGNVMIDTLIRLLPLAELCPKTICRILMRSSLCIGLQTWMTARHCNASFDRLQKLANSLRLRSRRIR